MYYVVFSGIRLLICNRNSYMVHRLLVPAIPGASTVPGWAAADGCRTGTSCSTCTTPHLCNSVYQVSACLVLLLSMHARLAHKHIDLPRYI